MHLKFSLLLLFTSLTILWCYHRDWPTHHCHTIRVKLVFRSPIQECEIIPFLLDTGTVCGHLACWISFCLKAKSGRRGIGLALVPAALLFPSTPGRPACNPVIMCLWRKRWPHTHQPTLSNLPIFSRRPYWPHQCCIPNRGEWFCKIRGMVPGRAQGKDALFSLCQSAEHLKRAGVWKNKEMLFLSDHSRWTDHQQEPRIREERNEKANRDIQSISLLIHSQFCQDHMPDEIQLRFPRGLSYDPIVLTAEIFPDIQFTFCI